MQGISGLSCGLEKIYPEAFFFCGFSSSSPHENLYTLLHRPCKSFDHAMAERVRSLPLIAETRLNTGLVCMEIMVDILALRLFSLWLSPFSPESVIAPMPHSYISLIYHSSCIIWATNSLIKRTRRPVSYKLLLAIHTEHRTADPCCLLGVAWFFIQPGNLIAWLSFFFVFLFFPTRYLSFLTKKKFLYNHSYRTSWLSYLELRLTEFAAVLTALFVLFIVLSRRVLSWNHKWARNVWGRRNIHAPSRWVFHHAKIFNMPFNIFLSTHS